MSHAASRFAWRGATWLAMLAVSNCARPRASAAPALVARQEAQSQSNPPPSASQRYANTDDARGEVERMLGVVAKYRQLSPRGHVASRVLSRGALVEMVRAHVQREVP